MVSNLHYQSPCSGHQGHVMSGEGEAEVRGRSGTVPAARRSRFAKPIAFWVKLLNRSWEK